MDSWTILGLAWALAMDAFAVATAIAAGLADRLTSRHTFRLSWHFGLFQSMMTLIGWLGGAGLAALMGGIDKWLAFGLLSFLGLRMIRQSRHPESQQRSYDPTRGWSLVGLSLATSMDALAVGVSLGLIGVAIWLPAGVIGMVAMVLTYTGTRIGKKAGQHLGQWAEGLGGVVLLIIGCRILIRHLTG